MKEAIGCLNFFEKFPTANTCSKGSQTKYILIDSNTKWRSVSYLLVQGRYRNGMKTVYGIPGIDIRGYLVW